MTNYNPRTEQVQEMNIAPLISALQKTKTIRKTAPKSFKSYSPRQLDESTNTFSIVRAKKKLGKVGKADSLGKTNSEPCPNFQLKKQEENKNLKLIKKLEKIQTISEKIKLIEKELN